MLYPHVTEIARAGRVSPPFARTRRERVELSPRLNPIRTVRPVVDRDQPRGIWR